MLPPPSAQASALAAIEAGVDAEHAAAGIAGATVVGSGAVDVFTPAEPRPLEAREFDGDDKYRAAVDETGSDLPMPRVRIPQRGLLTHIIRTSHTHIIRTLLPSAFPIPRCTHAYALFSLWRVHSSLRGGTTSNRCATA